METRWLWPFELEEQIGAGGMGVVYRARYVGNNRKVALKLLPAHIASNPTLSTRFERELAILKDLRHPHIVHCFGGTCEGDQWFYAMELVEGGSIEALLKEKGRLLWERVVEYGLQLCSALAHAHDLGVIHRDIKPANLLLTKADKLKLSDFGLAIVSDESRLTAAGKTMGTYHYMAPEQIRGSPPLSNKTDLYAMGCVLFEMLTGTPPFSGTAAAEILHRHLNQSPPRITAIALDCPPSLESIVNDLLEKDPERRPASAALVAERLKAVEPVVEIRSRRPPELDSDNVPTKTIDGNQVRLATMVPAPQVAPAPNRLNRWLAGAVVVLAIALAWSLSSGAGSPQSGRADALWVAALNDKSIDVKLAAVRALGEIGSATEFTVNALTPLLDDPDAALREETVVSLGKLGFDARSAVTPLMRVQKMDTHTHVREQADAALAKIRNAKPGGSVMVHVLTVIVLAGLAGGAWTWRERWLPRQVLTPSLKRPLKVR